MTEQQIFSAMRDELAETSEPTSPFVTADRILVIASRTLRDHGCDAYPAIRAAVDTAFETFVRPIDLPYVGGAIEVAIESAVKKLLLDACDAVHARVCPVIGV